MKRRKGQAILLLLALLMVFAAMAFWLLDIRSTVMARLRAQDGGDAAALAAARCQATGINLCGELNLIQAYMLADDLDNAEAAQALHELRQRVQLVATTLGFYAAERTAELAKLDVLPEADDYIDQLSKTVMFQGLYEGAEADLEEMLQVVLKAACYHRAQEVAAERQIEEGSEDFEALTEEPGLRVFPFSPVLTYDSSKSLLANESFYEAIWARNWCWFYNTCYDLLVHYRSPRDFGEPPEVVAEAFFGLRLAEYACSLDELLVLSETMPTDIDAALSALDHPTLPPPPPPPDAAEGAKGAAKAEANAGKDEAAPHPALVERPMTELDCTGLMPEEADRRKIKWTVWNEKEWRGWWEMTNNHLPLRSELKDCYDYFGCNAPVSVQSGEASWLAVAKPFGKLSVEGAESETSAENNPVNCPLVLGGFDAVRLVPVDSGDWGVCGYNIAWLRHLRYHISDFYHFNRLADDCRYCDALRQWEDPFFRSAATSWLALFSDKCRKCCGGTEGDRGGTNYAH